MAPRRRGGSASTRSPSTNASALNSRGFVVLWRGGCGGPTGADVRGVARRTRRRGDDEHGMAIDSPRASEFSSSGSCGPDAERVKVPMEAQEPWEWQRGERVGNHVIVRVAGRGGMAVVYEVTHAELGHRAALKVLLPELARRADVLTRFLQEGRAVARVQHPHVVKVFDVGMHEGFPWLLMEYLEGPTLHARLAQGVSLSVEAALELMLPVVAAMATAHDEAVVHRDLKPANIVLERTREGVTRPVVVDFGIAMLADRDEAHTGPNELLGTPAWFSPEHTRGAAAITPLSDQFCLGSIVYNCLTGQRPFSGARWFDTAAKIAAGDFVPPRALRPDLPEALEAVVLRAMALDPARRFPTLRAMGAALLPFASERVRLHWERAFVSDDELTRERSVPHEPVREVAEASPTAPAEKPRKKSATRWIAVAVAAALIAMASACCVWRAPGETTYAVDVTVTPPEASIAIDGRVVAHGRYASHFTKDGTPHELVVEAPGYEPEETTFVNAPPASLIVLRRRGVTPPPAPTPTPAPVVVQRLEPTPREVTPVTVSPPPRTDPAPRRSRRGRDTRPRDEAPTESAPPRGTNGALNLKG